MSDAPRYSTLRDYLRVLRAHRLLILLTTAVFASAGWVLTVGDTKTYEAEAALNFRGIGEDLELFGATPVPRLGPAERAAVGAELVERRSVGEEVLRRLPESAAYDLDELRGTTDAQVEARTNFAVIQAVASRPRLAADVANTLAEVVRDKATDLEKRRFDRAAEILRRRYRKLIEGSGQDNFSRNLYQERIARLSALADFSQPVEIARVAEPPDGTIGPKPVRDSLLGALIGLVLGIVAAFARDALDTRLRGPRDVESKLGLPVIGQVSSNALRRHGGDGQEALPPGELEAFHILRTNLTFLDRERVLRSIAITSAVPEEGKSTVALALARSHAGAGRSTLLLETDLRRPSLAERLGIPRAPGLAEYLTGQAASHEVLRTVSADTALGTNGDGGPARLDCITAGETVERPAELLSGQDFVDLLAALGRSYDIVLLDCAPLLPVVDTLQLLPNVDGILLCLRASSTTRDQAVSAKVALARLPAKPTGLVLTGVREGRQQDYGYYAVEGSPERERSAAS